MINIRMYKKWKIKMYSFIHSYFQNFVIFILTSLTKQKLKDKHIYKTDEYSFWTSDIPVGIHDGFLFFH